MPRSIQEALSEALEAQEQQPAEHGINAEPVEIGREPEPAQRERDEGGRFAKEQAEQAKPEKTLRLKDAARSEGPKRDPKTGGHVKEAVTNAEAQPEDQQAVETPAAQASGKPGVAEGQAAQPQAEIAPPSDWKGGAKVKWAMLPRDVKAEIAEDYKHVATAKALNIAIDPYRATIQQRFGAAPSEQVIGEIMRGWSHAINQPTDFGALFVNSMSNGKPIDFLREMVQKLGVDPRLLAGADNGQSHAQPELQQPNDPVIARLEQQLQQVTGQLQHLAQQPVIAQNAQIDTEIQAFQADPAHPYFNDVKPVMAALMGTKGGPATLKEAYDMACYANPQIRAALVTQSQAKEQEARKQATARAQGAAVQVNGAPGVARPAASQIKSVTEALSRNYDTMVGNGRA